ncbi:hypothetical protein HCUR_00020 [Holospora curviuscula]|uniref:Uncharacterized protein n=1 Tax=Holospora curviuscula TaxID=1082868 RepID=A0A2S5RI09_9PROT|nr:hypothetical protein HCUR_00020 [Holospora curviuscula]
MPFWTISIANHQKNKINGISRENSCFYLPVHLKRRNFCMCFLAQISKGLSFLSVYSSWCALTLAITHVACMVVIFLRWPECHQILLTYITYCGYCSRPKVVCRANS